ncbi:hypothetical protein FXO38_35561 [Capsicum annuum]|uniref:AAA-type ATPase N-terminal domain-containing protein n=2 Tax=Capsicum annuum TaxID=4072 RepID=A0A2G2ZML4_CAPAN|nr:hypothetical protein FXO38_35561 [Capsicum annuum]KAF3627594.1 hypothetical protein FXO37_29793 [Capsicum annuum]PHT83191.1 hypothetical protein T459_11634 [Capsicum annuum]
MPILSSIALGVTIAARLPKVVNDYRALFSLIKRCSSKFSNKVTMVIDEFDGQGKNEIYEAAEIYLCNNLSTKNRKIKASKTEKEKNSIKVTLEHNERVKHVYDGHKFKWTWQEFKCFDHPKDINSVFRSEVKSFKLKFKKKHKDYVLETYLPYIMKEAKYLKG